MKFLLMGNIIDLTKKEYEILLYFIVNRNKVITRESIAEHVWGDIYLLCR